jgi:hypothetical protein
MPEGRTTGRPALALELIERIDHVAQEMESIGYLDGVWCAESDSISDAESAVVRDDTGTGMLAQPTRQGCGGGLSAIQLWIPTEAFGRAG